MTDSHKTDDVFGIQREVPANYVTRENVDDVFVESLTRNKHIVVYGSSKQGKTSLRKYNLKPDEYITIMCSNSATLSMLHSVILKEAGYTIEQSVTKTYSGDSKINAKISAGVNAGFFHAGAEVGGEDGGTEAVAIDEITLELDPGDVNDIIRALEEIDFDKYIVLEDFHYLPIETQEAFSVALKAFHEQSSFTFIVVGVWLDENRLIQFNGDLTGRVLSVDADAWSAQELAEVMAKGERLLNIQFHPGMRDALLSGCFDSVYIVQEACYRICIDAEVHSTCKDVLVVGETTDIPQLIRDVVSEQSARYGKFLDGFSGGLQETEYEMHKWILLPILIATSSELESGLAWNTLRKVIDANHPKAPVNPGNLTQALGSVASLQVKRKITPIVVDYDQTNKRIDVVDRGFLIWLNYQNLADLRTDLGLPVDPTIPRTLTIGGSGQRAMGSLK